MGESKGRSTHCLEDVRSKAIPGRGDSTGKRIEANGNTITFFGAGGASEMGLAKYGGVKRREMRQTVHLSSQADCWVLAKRPKDSSSQPTRTLSIGDAGPHTSST